MENNKSGIKSRSELSLIIFSVGWLAIVFGFGLGCFLIWQLPQVQQGTQMSFSAKDSELTFSQFILSVSASLLFMVPGFLCLGLSKVMASLEKLDRN